MAQQANHESRLRGHMPTGIGFEVWGAQGGFGGILSVAIWKPGRPEFRCIILPQNWSFVWGALAAWLVLTHKGVRGLDAWLKGNPVIIAPTAGRELGRDPGGARDGSPRPDDGRPKKRRREMAEMSTVHLASVSPARSAGASPQAPLTPLNSTAAAWPNR